MKVGGVSDDDFLIDESEAALFYGGIEIVERLEMGVDERLVDVFPEAFGGLKLRAVRGLEDEIEAVGNVEIFGSVPAGVVELQDDAFLRAGADRSGEVGEDRLEQFLADRI